MQTRRMPRHAEEPVSSLPSFGRIGELACEALLLELDTWPKPGLVSYRDSGSHVDMDAGMFSTSARALRPYFEELAEAGAADAEMEELRAIGRAAERAMLEATAGVNTHRGAIFGLGLLCAAAGAISSGQARLLPGGSLGDFVRDRWGSAILNGPIPTQSHGSKMRLRYGAGGARGEAATGFPHVYRTGLPALRTGCCLAHGDRNAARSHTCFALIAELQDTNLLYRTGEAGMLFAQVTARKFLSEGGVGRRDWHARALKIHRQFVLRWLSPGGCADLLAATLLVSALEAAGLPGAPPQSS